MKKFDPSDIKKLYSPPTNSTKNENGRVTIIGGSKLFHGAPLLALTTASRIVDMAFFASPDPSVGEVASQIKSNLFSFIWTPWQEVEEYIEGSDAILIGPGFMRFRSEKSLNADEYNRDDSAWKETSEITERLLKKFPNKKWVIDAGSLQVMSPDWIPAGSVLTPNQKEYKVLFGDLLPEEASEKYKCTIVIKGPTTFVYGEGEVVEVTGGNPGLTKGGTGDIQAGLTVALFAKNDAIPAASSAAYIIKAAADKLYSKFGTAYNSDDLADVLPTVFADLTNGEAK